MRDLWVSQKRGHGISLGRPVGLTKIKGYGISLGRPVGTTKEC